MESSSPLQSYLIVIGLGVITAVAELLSRYKSHKAIATIPSSWIYLALNGGASALGLWIINAFDIKLGAATEGEVGKVLLAGLGSMMILRSSLASLGSGDKTTAVGLAPIVEAFMTAAERTFNQDKSGKELGKVTVIMRGVSFRPARTNLPITCFNLMSQFPDIDQKQVLDDIGVLAEDKDMDERTKTINLGVIISRVTGADLLEKAVNSLKDVVKPDEKLEELKVKLQAGQSRASSAAANTKRSEATLPPTETKAPMSNQT